VSRVLTCMHATKIGEGGPTRILLIVKALVEAPAGIALVASPAMAVSLLTGQRFDEPAVGVLGRIAGVSLVALGIACWLAHKQSQSRAAIGLTWALLFYDVSVVLIFLSARFGMGIHGVALWPAVALHSGLGIWSLLCLRNVMRVTSPGPFNQ